MTPVRVSALTCAVWLAFGCSLAVADPSVGTPRRQGIVKFGSTSVSPIGRYIVTFAEAGLVDYQGSVPGLERTAPSRDLVSANTSRKLEGNSQAAVAYRSYLDAQRAAHLTSLEQALRRSLVVRYTYDVARNAVSVELSAAEAERAAHVEGVVSVSAVKVVQPVTYHSPSFIAADTIWNGTSVPNYATATRGEGVKVAVVDTGAFAAHPSFANDVACGFDDTHPKLFAKDCIDSSNCTGSSPEADPNNGHGVHTSSIAAGNTIDNTATPAPFLPDGVKMSGVAPCSEVHTYKVCSNDSGCAGDAIEAGIQTAIVDQVDTLNYSMGYYCESTDPWSDSVSQDFLAAESANIFVAAAAGNTQPDCTDPKGLVDNNGPWLTTVAASTQNQILGAQLSEVGPGTPPDLTQVIALTSGNTTREPADTTDMSSAPTLVYEQNLLGCTASGGFPGGYFTGSIAIIQRGTCSFAEKILNAYGAGARTVIVTNNVPGGPIIMDTSALPSAIANDVAAFSCDQAAGDALIAFVEANSGATARYDHWVVNSIQGDILGSFSLRGPTTAPFQDLTKPDVAAPGVSIFASLDAAEGYYAFETGTSMASPHVAGAAALIRAVHPDWTPMEIKSALQTTATLTGTQENGSTVWTPDQVGSGRVDLSLATLAALTLDETEENFRAADPNSPGAGDTDVVFADGFDPLQSKVPQLNLASLRNVECQAGCTWVRTLRNRLMTSGSWTLSATDPPGYHLSIEPATFALSAGETQTITVTAEPLAPPRSGMQYGRIDLATDGSLSPAQHLTVSVSDGATLSVTCTAGDCLFQFDHLNGYINGWGCLGWYADCQLIWLNRFTPDAADYPITLTAVSTGFLDQAGWNAAGDQVSLYIYQDDDHDPSNGAVPVAVQHYTITPTNSTILIPLDPPVVLNGPGDVLVGFGNPYPTNGGGTPDISDLGPFEHRSWKGTAIDDANGTVAPDLASPTVNLLPNDDPAVDYPYNWIIRAEGTNASGRSITLGTNKQ